MALEYPRATSINYETQNTYLYKPLNFKHLYKQQNYSPSTTAKNIELWTANKIIHRPQLEKKWSYGRQIN